MSIDRIVSEYIRIHAEKADLERYEKQLKEMILQHANGGSSFDTEHFTVIIRETKSIRLDTSALYKDFPDVKETYGKETVSKTVVPAARPAVAVKKTA